MQNVLRCQSLPLHKGGLKLRDNVKKDGFVEEPVDGWQLLVARLAGQSLAHLCAASNIRAMPETEIPPRYAGGIIIKMCNPAARPSP